MSSAILNFFSHPALAHHNPAHLLQRKQSYKRQMCEVFILPQNSCALLLVEKHCLLYLHYKMKSEYLCELGRTSCLIPKNKQVLDQYTFTLMTQSYFDKF